jgi:hypothetical protein
MPDVDIIYFAASHVCSQLTSHNLRSIFLAILHLFFKETWQAGQCHSSDWSVLGQAPWL